MAKEAYFFSHDTNARQDPKLQEVLMELGLVGIGAYWCIIEMLYEQGGTLPVKSYKTIAFTLHVEVEIIRSLVEDFGLFNNDGDEFWSEAVLKRSEKRKELSDKRRTASNKRWNDESDANAMQMDSKCNAKEKQCDANAMQTETTCNANPIYKEKKIKEKEIKENNCLCNSGARTHECATPTDTQDFLEIFFFEKNYKDPLGEVQRFIANYEANGWCRAGSTTPVKDRKALARLWKPQTEGARFNDKALQWLGDVYRKAKGADTAEAIRIMVEVLGMAWEVQGDGITLTIYCTPAAKQVIERNYVHRRGLTIRWQLKND